MIASPSVIIFCRAILKKEKGIGNRSLNIHVCLPEKWSKTNTEVKLAIYLNF
jgi:hypothetical protein